MKHKHIIIFAALLFVVGVSTYVYWTDFTKQETIKVTSSHDYPVAETIDDMTKQSDVVVLGEYTSFDSTWNMARNPDDPSQPDEDNYTEGHLYNFKIVEVVKGNIPSETIKINLRYEETIPLITEQGKKEKIKNKDPLYQKPEFGHRYLLFLNKNKDFDHYYSAVEPFQIMIHKDGKAELKTNLTDKNITIQTLEVDGKKVVLENHAYREEFTDRISGKSLQEILDRIQDITKQ